MQESHNRYIVTDVCDWLGEDFEELALAFGPALLQLLGRVSLCSSVATVRRPTVKVMAWPPPDKGLATDMVSCFPPG